MLSALDFNFIKHVSEHNLSYATVEEFEARKEIYAAKEAIFEEINNDPANTFTVGHNAYSTWTTGEMKRLNGYVAWSPNVITLRTTHQTLTPSTGSPREPSPPSRTRDLADQLGLLLHWSHGRCLLHQDRKARIPL